MRVIDLVHVDTSGVESEVASGFSSGVTSGVASGFASRFASGARLTWFIQMQSKMQVGLQVEL